MSTIRYEGSFYSAYTSKEYTVSIYDTSGSFVKKEVTIIDCELSYLAGDETRFDTVMTAELTTKLLINDSDLDNFIEDIAGAPEGRFIVVLKEGNNFEFIGYMLPDLAEQEDVPIEVGYQFTLKATDGLARLKDIEYLIPGIPYLDMSSMITIILRCLNKLTEVTGFYGTKSDFLKTRINWHSDKYTYANTIDPFLNSRMPDRAFYTRDTKGNIKYNSCFEVLTKICRAWGARMMYSNGSFWITQVNELANGGSLKYFTYTKTGTQTSETLNLLITQDQNSPDTTDVLRLSGGLFRFFPPLKFVEVDYKHIATENLLAGYTWSDFIGTNPQLVAQVDDQFGTARIATSLLLSYRAENFTTPPGDIGLWFVFNITVQVNGAYLNRQVYFINGYPEYGSIGWSGSATNGYQIAVYVPSSLQTYYQNVFFVSENISGSGDLIFDVYLHSVYDNAGNIINTPVATYTWGADNIVVEHLYEGTFSAQSDIRRFVATNDFTTNSAVQRITTFIGDGIGLNSPGHLQVKDDTAAWVLAEDWRVGNSGSYIPFSALLAQEFIRGQLTPVRKWEGTHINMNGALLRAHNVINRTDGKLVMMSGTFRLGRDEVSGQWFYLNTASSGWTNEAFVDFPEGEGADAGRPKTGMLTGDGSSAPILKTFRVEFAGSDLPYTVTANNGILPSNLAQFTLYMNGQMLSDNWYTVTGSVVALTFAPEKDDVFVIIFTTL